MDLNSHLVTFIESCDTIKLNGVSEDAIRLRLFPFLLRDKAKVWLNSHRPNTFTSWEDLSRLFLNKYFSSARTAKLRMDITNFCQQEGKSLYETWERFWELQRRCPHHGLPHWFIVQTFYNGLNFTIKTHVDAVAKGALMGKLAVQTHELIEKWPRTIINELTREVTLEGRQVCLNLIVLIC